MLKKSPQKNAGWKQGASFYEIYPRLYKSFEAISKDLPRIASLGFDAIYLMPIYPTGKKNKKGKLGSPYAVKDFLGINLEFVIGKKTVKNAEKQFTSLVKKAHKLGLKIILDLVLGHSAVDNILLDKNNPEEKGGYHPEWFFFDNNGNVLPPDAEWSDTADLKYGEGEDEKNKPKYEKAKTKNAMWGFMSSVPKYWLEKFDVDGFRCDFAHFVPLNFWKKTIRECRKIKPEIVFIAEAYERMPEHIKAGFDATYAFEIYNQLKTLYNEVRDDNPYFEIPHLKEKIEWENLNYPRNYQMLRYAENHDEMRATEMYGGPQNALTISLLAATLPGMFLIYNGQELGETVRPPLFKNDRGMAKIPKINFNKKSDLALRYAKILDLRNNYESFKKGKLFLLNSENNKFFAFLREYKDERILIVINFNYTNEAKEWGRIFLNENIKNKFPKNISYKLKDILDGEVYYTDGETLQKGLVVGLEKHQHHIFLIQKNT